ncbi:MAG: hypothetical protein ACTHKJ_01825 [Candidatus Nitrosocosmicus sp.]
MVSSLDSLFVLGYIKNKLVLMEMIYHGLVKILDVLSNLDASIIIINNVIIGNRIGIIDGG